MNICVTLQGFISVVQFTKCRVGINLIDRNKKFSFLLQRNADELVGLF